MKPINARGRTSHPACSADSGSRCSKAKPLMVIRQKLSRTTVDQVCERSSQTISGPAHKAKNPSARNHSDDRLESIGKLREDSTRRQSRTTRLPTTAKSLVV